MNLLRLATVRLATLRLVNLQRAKLQLPALIATVVLGACEAKESTADANDGVGAAGAPGQMNSSASTSSTTGDSVPTNGMLPTDVEPPPSSEGMLPDDPESSQTGSDLGSDPSSEPGGDPGDPGSLSDVSDVVTSDGPAGTPSAQPNEPAATSSEGGATDVSDTGAGAGDSMTNSEGSASEPPGAVDPCADALLCDDFEDDALAMGPGAPWTSDTNGGTVEVSSERAFSGDNSVHVANSPGAYKRAFFSVQGEPLFPAAGQEMFGRMMMWLDATPAGSVHWTFIQGEGPSDDGSYDIFYRYGGQHDGKLMANFETQGKATDCWDHSATVMPTQTWACIEWRFNTANDEMQFWLDGTELSDIHPVGTGEGCVSQDLDGQWPAPAQFEVLRLGWEKYQESTQLDAWIDDVVVATERVGCPE